LTAYASGTDLIARYDVDLVGDLATDSREPIEQSAVPNLPLVATALLDASGMIDVNLATGGRYRPEDLQSLTGNSVSHLKRIACDIAMGLLLQRRTDKKYQELAEKVVAGAKQNLMALARGENVFGIPALQNSGTIEYQTVSAVAIDGRNALPSRMDRYFPPTQTVIPRQ
jgi:phage gp36-like protein